MSEYSISLITAAASEQISPLHPQGGVISVAEINQSTLLPVFFDYQYYGTLLCPDSQSVTEFEFYVNDQFVETQFVPESGKFSIIDPTDQRIFRECYGLVQLSVSFSDSEGSHQLESNYFQVMIRKGMQNDSVSRMVDYIYQNCEALLYDKSIFPQELANLKEGETKTIETCLQLLRRIYQIYDKNYREFQQNSRYAIVHEERVDCFEKLRFISSPTLQYIVRHPEELQPVTSIGGIRLQKQSYQPRHTLVTATTPSFDIYENRVVLGFLYTLLSEIEKMKKGILVLIQQLPSKERTIGEYISSSQLVYLGVRKRLERYQNELHTLKLRYQELFQSYSSVFCISPEKLFKEPRPTAIFMSLPHYRAIFDSVLAWFRVGAYDLRDERYLLSFLRVSMIYERYVLTKLIQYLESEGFQLVDAYRKIYNTPPGSLYSNTTCNNIFCFKSSHGNLTLFYQPIIYSGNSPYKNDTGLYRNISLSFPKRWGSRRPSSTPLYTPDFLVKYEPLGQETLSAHYLIADGKFSTIETVKKWDIVELIYKYLFSISPLSPNDNVTGLCVFNGQSHRKIDTLVSVYDISPTPQDISPQVDILTLTENDTKNQSLHHELLKKIFAQLLEA